MTQFGAPRRIRIINRSFRSASPSRAATAAPCTLPTPGSPPVDLDVVQIRETMQSSRPLPISQISPGNNVESSITSINLSDATLSDGIPCPDDYLGAPEDQIRCVPSLDHHAIETFDPYPSDTSQCSDYVTDH
jgi:hypothetical protein